MDFSVTFPVHRATLTPAVYFEHIVLGCDDLIILMNFLNKM